MNYCQFTVLLKKHQLTIHSNFNMEVHCNLDYDTHEDTCKVFHKSAFEILPFTLLANKNPSWCENTRCFTLKFKVLKSRFAMLHMVARAHWTICRSNLVTYLPRQTCTNSSVMFQTTQVIEHNKCMLCHGYVLPWIINLN